MLRFKERLAPHEGRIPEAAGKVIDEELTKLSMLEPASSEFNVTRNYLDWLTGIPWGHYTPELLDIQHAQTVRFLTSIMQKACYVHGIKCTHVRHRSCSIYRRRCNHIRPLPVQNSKPKTSCHESYNV